MPGTKTADLEDPDKSSVFWWALHVTSVHSCREERRHVLVVITDELERIGQKYWSEVAWMRHFQSHNLLRIELNWKRGGGARCSDHFPKYRRDEFVFWRAIRSAPYDPCASETINSAQRRNFLLSEISFWDDSYTTFSVGEEGGTPIINSRIGKLRESDSG